MIQIPGSGKTNEIDVLVEKDGKVIVVECKATRAAVDEKFAEKWLNKNIPQIRSWLIEKYPDIKKFEFQLWSLGGFSPDALTLLENAAGKTQKYKVEFWDGVQIIELAAQQNVQPVVTIFCIYHDDKYSKCNQ